MVGGSHAEQYSAPLDRLGKEMGFKLVPLLRQGCPIELGDDVTVTPECAEWGKLVMDRIEEANPALVISNTTRPQNEYGTGPDAVPAGYQAFWDELADRDIPFLGFRDNPWGFDEEGRPREFDECYVASEDAYGCGMRFEQVYQPFDPGAVVLSKYQNMLSIDTAPWFCDANGDCPVIIGNTMVYRDMHHITNAFAESAMPMIREALKPFLDGEKVQQEAPDVPPEQAAGAVEQAPAAPTNASKQHANPVPYPNAAQDDAV